MERHLYETIPRRGLWVGSVTLATAALLAATTAAALAGAWGAGLFASAGDVVGAGRPDLERLAGAWAYLVIIGLLAHAVALCVGHLVPSLVTTLSAVLVVSPLLTALTEHARWLSDQAAGLMYRGGDGVLDGGTGVLVAVAWLLTVGLTGAWLTVRRGA
ncbi:hypothetical protein [Mobilicoccus massiliensis]|uniref:hypothetical protein n=1 Tax=Mobilicoccus massiliensis TaxID=1522310 RepID=UPI000590544E|nr:hypothetical protein [Mobilicoccus massiliensis]